MGIERRKKRGFRLRRILETTAIENWSELSSIQWEEVTAESKEEERSADEWEKVGDEEEVNGRNMKIVIPFSGDGAAERRAEQKRTSCAIREREESR